eukprot:CAMPEP_0197175946 /NCGR_PEP_ID=MMETSP1423-20130617/2024_1 /TAXON_ID=476441 /ORGANISM="Pseudo-nitzschia heimii, Strain UNC1101" /LENGTH=1073 /DNA_ID=CAMNT_0042625217 /DNA_START=165 /DNA_END=3383 /DNA_ORIENTATION=-
MVDHGKSTKRKKFHDKDKYYKLAKEQGLRSRAAFKLSQINRTYPLLHSKTNVVLDLCAAPGGWTQVVGRTCGPQTAIIAVDILPIRSLGKRNITTIVGDITTDKCKADINRAVIESTTSSTGERRNKKEGLVDVVLHDGAPNIGASYDKDAYAQTELAVHALRCATQHLRHMGSFVTKIYRSKDSASFQWVAKQLFREVTTFKPKASRQQSAEIFYVCQGYYKPDKIDPRLLDPKHIFEFVDGDTQGGGKPTIGGADKKFNVFHKSWDAAKRQRGGYDMDHLDGTMRHIQPVSKFVFESSSTMDAIQMLSNCTGFSFQPDESDPLDAKRSSFLLNHPLTSSEIKTCVVDLKLLNKGDFKGLVAWREKMLKIWKEVQKSEGSGDSSDDDDDSDSDSDEEDSDGYSVGEDDEDDIQKQIKKARERKLRERKKAKKKERKLMAKKRRQAAFGMDLNAIDIQEHDQFFSLSTLRDAKDLEDVAEVNLDKVTQEEAFGKESDDESDDDEYGGANYLKKKGIPERDEKSGYSFRMESELDLAYERFIENTKNNENKVGTKSAKRSKKLLREKMAQQSHEDHEMLLTGKKGITQDAKAYAKLLQGGKDSDDEDGSDGNGNDEEGNYEEDDGFNDEPMTPAEHEAKRKQKAASKKKSSLDIGSIAGRENANPLIHQFPDEPTPMKTARWFSNPLFAEIGEAVNAAAAASSGGKKKSSSKDPIDPLPDDSCNDSDHSRDVGDATKRKPATKKAASNKAKRETKLTAEDVLASMPKTDKQKRHEKRIKAKERDERRMARRAKRMGDEEGDFDLVPMKAPAQDDDEDDYDDDELMRMEGMSEEKKQKIIEARKLIKAGMGKTSSSKKDEKSGFQVVEKDRPLPIKDDRAYDTENEEYDSDDHVETLALGTMMLRHSKAKSLVDASYNRFAWNDPSDLPEWFVDDENRHYRPQLPIPEALLAKMKEKMIALSTKPIAKVAEARARKNRKAKLKLAAARKKAQVVANSSEMSEAMKLKSISKALRSDDRKGSGKQYIVSKKGQGKKGVKGGVMVDKKMKSDKRGMERATKKRKHGKKGGLTGSKRR